MPAVAPAGLTRRGAEALLPHWKILLLYTAVEIIGTVVAARPRGDSPQQLDDGLIIAAVPIVAAIIPTAMGQTVWMLGGFPAWSSGWSESHSWSAST